MTIHGSGEQTRDWIFTIDTAKAVDAVLHHENFDALKQQVINIGSGKAVSVLEIARMILRRFELPVSYLQFIGDRPGQVECHISSTEKAKNLLNWSASTTLEEGLAQTIDWYIANPEIWEKMIPDVFNTIITTSGTLEEH